jgi:hypothetical protein
VGQPPRAICSPSCGARRARSTGSTCANSGLESALEVQRRADLRQHDERGHGPARRREAVDVGDAAEEQVRALGVLPGLAQGEGKTGPPDREVGVPLDVAGQVGGEQLGHPALLPQQPVGLAEAGLGRLSAGTA